MSSRRPTFNAIWGTRQSRYGSSTPRRRKRGCSRRSSSRTPYDPGGEPSSVRADPLDRTHSTRYCSSCERRTGSLLRGPAASRPTAGRTRQGDRMLRGFERLVLDLLSSSPIRSRRGLRTLPRRRSGLGARSRGGRTIDPSVANSISRDEVAEEAKRSRHATAPSTSLTEDDRASRGPGRVRSRQLLFEKLEYLFDRLDWQLCLQPADGIFDTFFPERAGS